MINYIHFNPAEEYEDYTKFSKDHINIEGVCLLHNLCDIQILEQVPPLYRHRIEFTIVPPPKWPTDPLGTCGFLKWKYVP